MICQNCSKIEHTVRPRETEDDPIPMPLDERDYQEDAIEAIRYELEVEGKKRVACCLATGAGKTSVANLYISRHRNTSFVLWIAPTRELLQQACRNAKRIGIPSLFRIGLEDILTTLAPYPCFVEGGAIAYVTLQALHRRLEAPNGFGACMPSLIIWDESHWGECKIMGSKLKAWAKGNGDIPILGLTATPRFDSEFSIAFSAPLLSLAKKGFLAWPRIWSLNGDEPLDLKKSCCDDALIYNCAQQRFQIEDIIDWCVEHKSVCGKTYIKVSSINKAKEVAALLRQMGVMAWEIHCRLSPTKRRKHLQNFTDAKHPCVLVGVNICSQGIDIPDLRSIILTHNIQALGHYMQVVGRGSRLADGKTHFHIIECHPGLAKMRRALYLHSEHISTDSEDSQEEGR